MNIQSHLNVICHLNMLNVLADVAARVPLTAREIGRNPEGTYGAREWWAIFGSNLAEQGVEDGPELCDQIARYFATNYCTMHVRSLRASCNHQTLGAAMAYAKVPPERRPGITATLSDCLALEFITPVPSVSTLAAADSNEGRADSNEGRGGFKRQRFQTSDDGTTCGHRLSKLGRLGESIVIKQDFEHLKLPLLLKPKHKEKILLAAVEVTAVRQDDIYTDELYEQEMGTQLTNIFGTMPMGKRSVGSKVMDYAQLTPEQEAELAPSWQSSFYYKIRNVRSRRGQARHSDLPHTPIPAFAPTSRSPPLAVHVRLPSQYACPPCFRNSRTRQSFTQVRCRPGCS